jgi:O-antigen ligase
MSQGAPRQAPPNRFVSWILFTAVAGAPLPFGSNDPSAIAIWCIVLGAVLVLASPRALERRHFALLGLAGVVIAGYAIVLHEQLAVHPWFALATPHPVWREASDALGVELEPSVSIARNQPLLALGAPLAAMLSLICSFVVCADRDRARQLLQVVAWSGVAYALYGVVAFIVDPASLLWREKQAYVNVLTATFVNRNTAAVYFGSCAVVWLLILSERVRRRLPPGAIEWKKVPNRLLSDTPRALVLAFSMLFVCLAAMFMTGSRAGVVLSLLALVVAVAVYFRRDLPPRTGLVAAVAAGGAVALVLLQFMGAGVSSRFDAQGLADGGRFETWRSTLRLIADHPWVGTGQGTFEWAYPAYRSSDVSAWGVWDRAHSTPLELAADVGLPLAGLVALAWIIGLAVLAQGVRTRRRDLVVPVAALAVAILALLHSMVDFSLQTPGYAIVAFALLGAGLAQSLARSTRNDKSSALDTPTPQRSDSLSPEGRGPG